MEFLEAVNIMKDKLGSHKVMVLGTSVNDYPMTRSVSCIFYTEKIYFKTDKYFKKTQQLLINPQVALCFNGVQVEGIARNVGLVVDEKDLIFSKKFREYYYKTYNAYDHIENEILIEVDPVFVEIWDQDAENKAFQILIDFKEKKAIFKPYD